MGNQFAAGVGAQSPSTAPRPNGLYEHLAELLTYVDSLEHQVSAMQERLAGPRPVDKATPPNASGPLPVLTMAESAKARLSVLVSDVNSLLNLIGG